MGAFLCGSKPGPLESLSQHLAAAPQDQTTATARANSDVDEMGDCTPETAQMSSNARPSPLASHQDISSLEVPMLHSAERGSKAPPNQLASASKIPSTSHQAANTTKTVDPPLQPAKTRFAETFRKTSSKQGPLGRPRRYEKTHYTMHDANGSISMACGQGDFASKRKDMMAPGPLSLQSTISRPPAVHITSRPAKVFPWFRLPLELRNRIYALAGARMSWSVHEPHFWLRGHPTYQLSPLARTSPLLVSKQFRDEYKKELKFSADTLECRPWFGFGPKPLPNSAEVFGANLLRVDTLVLNFDDEKYGHAEMMTRNRASEKIRTCKPISLNIGRWETHANI